MVNLVVVAGDWWTPCQFVDVAMRKMCTSDDHIVHCTQFYEPLSILIYHATSFSSHNSLTVGVIAYNWWLIGVDHKLMLILTLVSHHISWSIALDDGEDDTCLSFLLSSVCSFQVSTPSDLSPCLSSEWWLPLPDVECHLCQSSALFPLWLSSSSQLQSICSHSHPGCPEDTDISLVTCASFPASYIGFWNVRVIYILVLAFRASVILSVASIWLSPLPFILVPHRDSGSPSHPVVVVIFVAASITITVFYKTGLLALSQIPNLED